MKKYIKISFFILLLLGITSCEQRYRYHCQDPNNLNDPECQKEKCEATRECPDFIKGNRHE